MSTQSPSFVIKGKQTQDSFYPYSYESQDWNYYESSIYGDRRLDSRKSSLVSRMVEKQSTIINQLSSDDSELRGYQRLISHKSLEAGRLITDLVDRSRDNFGNKEVFVLLDTCSLSFLKLGKRLNNSSGLGFTDNLNSWGCFLHPGLVMDAHGGNLLGVSEVLIWSLNRCAFGYNDRKREADPIETKSSYSWIWAAQSSKINLSEAKKVTFIADRQADIYEALSIIPDSKTHLIFRSSHDRTIVEGKGKLYAYLDQLPVAAHIEYEIRADKRIPRIGRKAQMELRFTSLHLKRPYKAKSSNIEEYPLTLAIQVIDIREKNPPNGENAIHWRLLTTEQVNDAKQAIYILECYRKRWYIEQLFRLLQNQGLNIERNRLFSAQAIIRLLIMALEAAMVILKLNLAYKGEEFIPIEEVFNPDEKLCLELLNTKLHPNTTRLQNPFGKDSLAWAAWIIARLGGWKGDPKKARPGPITLKRGYTRFLDIFWGYLVQNPPIDTS